MQRTSPSTLTLLVCLLPLTAAGCSLAAKAGLKVNGKPVGASNDAATTTAANEPASSATASQGSAQERAPAASPFAAPKEAPPAPKIGDSIGPIPASLAVAPAKGAPVIALTGASWCTDEVKGLDWDDNTERRFAKAMKKTGSIEFSGMDELKNIARFACGGTKSADRLTWVQSYMQAQANTIGISQPHLTHLMSVASRPGFDVQRFNNYAPEACESFAPKRNANALESQKNLRLRVGMGCADPSSADWMQWWVDRGSNLDSQVELLGWLHAVYSYSSRTVSLPKGLMGIHDAGTFDQAAYFAELAKAGADDLIIAKGIQRFYKAKKKIAEWNAHYEEELGDDFGLIVKSYKDGFAAWETAYKTDKAAIDFAFGIEEAVIEGDKRLFQGCSDKTQAFAGDFVMRHEPKSIEDFKRIAGLPMASLILASAYECEKAQGNALMASVYGALMQGSSVARGPRYAALKAAARTAAEIKEMKSRFPVRARDFSSYIPNDAFGRGHKGYFDTAAGTVARVDASGDMATLHFKKDTWNEPVYKCRETNKIDGISDSGKLIYRKVCKQTGTKKMSSQEKPVTIPKAAAGGIKKGSFVIASRNREQPSEGLPQQVYTNKDRKTLVNYFGLQLR